MLAIVLSNRGRIALLLCGNLLVLSGMLESALAADYLGADTVLRQVAERNAQPGQKPEKDASAQLRDDLKAFRENATNLAPAVAAQQWLALVDRAVKTQQQARHSLNSSMMPIRADDVFGALPPPAAWDDLAKAIRAQPPARGAGEPREAGLRLLAATLTGDVAGRNLVISNLQTAAQNANDEEASVYTGTLQQLEQVILENSDDPDAILKSLEYQLAAGGKYGPNQLQIPNLVAEIGREKAEAFLRQALVTPNTSLQFNSPNETSRLAQKLALELVDQLKLPQWALVNSIDAVALYEALDKKFGTPTNALPSLPGVPANLPGLGLPGTGDLGDDDHRGAELYYLLGLISQDRTQDAVTLAKKMRGNQMEYQFDEAFKAMNNSGYAVALDNFFHELLSQDPTLPFWDQYVEVAADAGQAERMLALVRSAVARADLGDKRKAALHQILFKALLAADDVDGAVQEARQLMTQGPTAAADNLYNPGQLGVMLARLGVLLAKPDLTEEGIGAAKKWLTASKGAQEMQNDDVDNVIESLVQTLIEKTGDQKPKPF